VNAFDQMGFGNIEGVGDFLNRRQLAIANRRDHQDAQGVVGIAGEPHGACRFAARRGCNKTSISKAPFSQLVDVADWLIAAEQN
jgi:hypothetical protein